MTTLTQVREALCDGVGGESRLTGARHCFGSADEDVSNKVHKRDDIKKMAEMSAMKHRKSRHRKQQGTDIVKAQERATSRLTRR